MTDNYSRCSACGEPIDYCQGHGEIGDPDGWDILARHDAGNHTLCHPEGCEGAGKRSGRFSVESALRTSLCYLSVL